MWSLTSPELVATFSAPQLTMLLLLHISLLVWGCLGRRLGCEEELRSTLHPTQEEEEQRNTLHITLLHVNDIHSHFEEVNVNTGTCKVGLLFLKNKKNQNLFCDRQLK